MIPEKETQYRSDEAFSIASKSATTYHGSGLGDKLIDSDILAEMIDRIFGITAPTGNTHPADELANLLVTIKEGLVLGGDNERKALNLIDDIIELTFLYSPSYKAAYRYYILGLFGCTNEGYGGLARKLAAPIEDAEKSKLRSDALRREYATAREEKGDSSEDASPEADDLKTRRRKADDRERQMQKLTRLHELMGTEDFERRLDRALDDDKADAPSESPESKYHRWAKTLTEIINSEELPEHISEAAHKVFSDVREEAVSAEIDKEETQIDLFVKGCQILSKSEKTDQ